MQTPRILLAIVAVAVLTNFVDASGGVRFGSNGFRVQMVPEDAGGVSNSRVAAANCDVKVQRSAMVLHFATTPFTHERRRELVSDAVLSATVTKKAGQLAVSPRQSVDRTDVSAGDESAAVAMGVQGNGVLNIKVQVGLDDKHAAAGRHCTTVVLTVAGN